MLCLNVSTCLSNLIYKSRSQMHLIHCLLIEFEYVNERLCNCTVIKEDHNAEKHVQYRLTTFGFEIKIMDKCCVVNSDSNS